MCVVTTRFLRCIRMSFKSEWNMLNWYWNFAAAITVPPIGRLLPIEKSYWGVTYQWIFQKSRRWECQGLSIGKIKHGCVPCFFFHQLAKFYVALTFQVLLESTDYTLSFILNHTFSPSYVIFILKFEFQFQRITFLNYVKLGCLFFDRWMIYGMDLTIID